MEESRSSFTRFLLFILKPVFFLVFAWRDLDKETTEYRAENPSEPRELVKTIYIFVVVAVSLTLQYYFGNPDTFEKIVSFIDDPSSPTESPVLFWLVEWMRPEDGGSLFAYIIKTGYYELWLLGYWAIWRVFGFLIIPIIAVIAFPGMSFKEVGLSFKGFTKHAWLYLVFFLPVLGAVIIVSFTEEFSTYYPFFSGAHESMFNFFVWEAFYIAQFFSLELFFRGFMIQPLRKRMGPVVILAMMVPYVMIHYDKPIMEVFGAIIAGIVLGTMALRTRSIWAGFLIHVGVAISMDVAAIWQTHWVR